MTTMADLDMIDLPREPVDASIADRATARVRAFRRGLGPWLFLLARRSPIGFGRLIRSLAGWWSDAPGRQRVRDQRAATAQIAAGVRGPDDAPRAHQANVDLDDAQGSHRAQMIRRSVMFLATCAVLTYVGTEAVSDLGILARVGLGLVGLPAIIGGLGFVGLDPGQPRRPDVVYRAPDGPPKRTVDLLVQALRHAGVGKLTSAIDVRIDAGFEPIEQTQPARDVTVGRAVVGWSARFRLPQGVTVADLVEDEQRRAIAGTFEVEVGQVAITRAGHEREVDLFIASQSLRARGLVTSELLDGPIERVDVFGLVPLGVDLMGRPVGFKLYTSDGGRFGLVAGQTGSGKTESLMVIGIWSALDPTVELHVFDFKAAPRLLDLETVAHVFVSSQDISAVASLISDMLALKTEIARRNEVMKRLKRTEPDLFRKGYCRALADRRDLGMHPILVLVDEPMPFEVDKHDKESKPLKDHARQLWQEVARQGRSVGVVALLGTQTVTDVSVPTNFVRNAGLRLAHSVDGSTANNQILGDGAAGKGYRADHLEPGIDADVGIGYLKADGEPIRMVKVAPILDLDDVEPLIDAARQFRADTDRLTGHAAGEAVQHHRDADTLDHVDVIWPGGPDAPYRTLIPLLADRFGPPYDHLAEMLDAGDQTGASKALGQMLVGVPSRTIARGQGTERPNGIRYSELRTAIEHRNDQLDTGDESDDDTSEVWS